MTITQAAILAKLLLTERTQQYTSVYEEALELNDFPHNDIPTLLAMVKYYHKYREVLPNYEVREVDKDDPVEAPYKLVVEDGTMHILDFFGLMEFVHVFSEVIACTYTESGNGRVTDAMIYYNAPLSPQVGKAFHLTFPNVQCDQEVTKETQ